MNRLKLDLAHTTAKLDSLEANRQLGKVLFEEVKVLFPQINAWSVGQQFFYTDSAEVPYYLVVVDADPGPFVNADQQKLKSWLASRLKADSIQLFVTD